MKNKYLEKEKSQWSGSETGFFHRRFEEIVHIAESQPRATPRAAERAGVVAMKSARYVVALDQVKLTERVWNEIDRGMEMARWDALQAAQQQ